MNTVSDMGPGGPNQVAPWESYLATSLLFLAVLFALLPPGFSWADAEDSSTFVGGSIGFQLQWGSIFAISVLLVVRHPAYLVWCLKNSNPFLLALFVYCLASTAWSPYGMVTLKKAVQIGGLILFSIAIQLDRKPWTHSVGVVLAALTGIELASVFVALVNPSFGIDAAFGYAWRGVVSGKNTLGAIGALSLLLWISLWRVEGVAKPVFWSGVGLSVVCVVMSTSSTSLTMAAVGLFIFWVFHKQHIGSPLWLQRLLVVMALVVLASLHLFFIAEGRLPEIHEILGPFAGLFGKSADLTGRADVWGPLYIEIAKHWVFGIGYGAFWLGPGSPSQPILDTLPWMPLQAHNGYLDLLNELGAVGCVLFAGLVLSQAQALSRLTRIDRRAAAVFSAVFATILISNLSESALFRGVVFNFLLMILSSTRITSMVGQR
jgi:O-antigen ligase